MICVAWDVLKRIDRTMPAKRGLAVVVVPPREGCVLFRQCSGQGDSEHNTAQHPRLKTLMECASSRHANKRLLFNCLGEAPLRRSTWLDWWLLLALVVLWGTAFTWTKIAVSEIEPATLVGVRLLIGAVILLGALLVLGRGIDSSRRHWLFYLLIGAVGNTIPFFLISWGQQAIDSGAAGILMAIMPLFTLVLAHYLLPDEPLSLNRILGFLLGFAGIVVLMGPESLLGLTRPESDSLAKLAVLAGAACYACAAVLARLRPAGDATGTAAATTLVGAALILPWLPWSVGNPERVWQVSSEVWLAVLLLGIFSTAVAAVVYFRLIERAGPAFVSQLNYLIPLWAVAIGMVFLDEEPEPAQGIALLLIFTGLYLAQRRAVTEKTADSRTGPTRPGSSELMQQQLLVTKNDTRRGRH